MAYSTEKLFEQAKKIAKDPDIYFINDIIGFLPCSKQTFYDHFPEDSDQLDSLKEIITENKITKKKEIRKKLGKSERAAELLSLYRLIAEPDERQKLNQQYVEHSGQIDTKVIRPKREA